MYAKGKMLIIGGAEDVGTRVLPNRNNRNGELQRYEILRELLNESKNKKIEIITSGSLFQAEVKEKYQKAFQDIGYMNPGFIQVEDKMEARKKFI